MWSIPTKKYYSALKERKFYNMEKLKDIKKDTMSFWLYEVLRVVKFIETEHIK